LQLARKWSVSSLAKLVLFSAAVLVTTTVLASAQGGPRPNDLGASPRPVGDAGVAWYTTWDTALAEARRSNRPIFFMAAAATCSGISGVF
jgi:hypothetical protein